MREEELHEEYFEWMTDIVEDDGRHGKMLRTLDSIPYSFTIMMDGNRAEDGVFLRYRFGYEVGYSDQIIASILDIRECSMLEMTIALCIRCYENLIDSSLYDNPISVWFWYMMANLGIADMTDENYNHGYLSFAVHRFLSGNYKRNGSGGLFRLDDYDGDVTKIELWKQACYFFNGIHKREESLFDSKGGL